MQCDHSTAIFAVYETSLFAGISGLFILRSGWVIFVAVYLKTFILFYRRPRFLIPLDMQLQRGSF